MYLITHFVFVFCSMLIWNCIVAEDSVKQDVFLKVATCFVPAMSSISYKWMNEKVCASECLKTKGCKSFSFETATQTCYLNDNVLHDTGCLNGFTHFNSKTALDNPECLNEGVFNQATNTCRCFNSYVGDRCERLMYDCSDGMMSGNYDDMVDIFSIHPPMSPSPIRVRCVMKYEGRTVILRRDKDEPYVNFTRDWNDYKIGFGDVDDGGNYYIGNDAIHFITANRKQSMMIAAAFDVTFRQYTHTGVQVADENDNYRLTYDGKWGHKTKPLGDCFPGNDIPFSTIDADNDPDPGSCALRYMSGWWFDNCGPCNPTGELQPSSETHQTGDPTSLHVVGGNNLAVRELTVYFLG